MPPLSWPRREGRSASSDTVACRISELVVDSAAPGRLAAFWCEVLVNVELDRSADNVEIGSQDSGFGGLQPTMILQSSSGPGTGKLACM
jgi:hypothetical protein